jgi:hypothetical protein
MRLLSQAAFDSIHFRYLQNRAQQHFEKGTLMSGDQIGMLVFGGCCLVLSGIAYTSYQSDDASVAVVVLAFPIAVISIVVALVAAIIWKFVLKR